MKVEDRMGMMQYLFAAAWADGALAEEEGEILATLLSGMDLDENELARVREWFANPPAEPDWGVLAQMPEMQEAIVRQAMVLAGSDMSYSVEEIQYLEKLRDRVGMANDRFQAIWQDVERLLMQGRS